jgi:hypothetical protein
MNFSIILLSLLASSFALAGERAVIQQMKGKRAIVQFEKDIPFSVGQKVYLNSEDGSELGVRKELRNPLERKNLVSLSGEITNTDTSPATATYNLSARYGWNMERYEFGPLGILEFQKQGSISSTERTRYEFGGFFDYNFVLNRPGEDLVWGVYGEASLGSAKANTTDKSLTVITGGGFVKWFFFSPMLAARANLFYSDEKQANSKASNTAGLQLGITDYF